MKVLTTEQILEFVEAMPVIGNGEVVFETGINPHSIFSPAYDMFEHDRANVNVLCFADTESTVYLPFWTKEQAMLWSLGLSLPNAPRVAKNSAPYLIDADAKTALLEWLDSFICHAEEKKKMSPQEWVNFAKNMPIADANKGIFQAFNSFLDDSILRKLWGVDRIEPTRFINDREISNNSKLFQFENINEVNVEAAPAKDEAVGTVKYSFETTNHINNTTIVITTPTIKADTAPVKDDGVPAAKCKPLDITSEVKPITTSTSTTVLETEPAAEVETVPIAEAEIAPSADVNKLSDIKLESLFDPVTVKVLEKMFATNGAKWQRWAERAARNGLINSRVGRSLFNPYNAAIWFVVKGEAGWDLARCYRVLSNNLPERSKDYKHLLTGVIE